MTLTKNMNGLENLLDYFQEKELKNIQLEEFEYAFTEDKEYDNALYYTKAKQIWFENKKDKERRFFVYISFVKSLEEIQYNKEPANIKFEVRILGNYAQTSFDGWETFAILHGKTGGLRPLFEFLEKMFERVKEGVEKDPKVRLNHLLSDNPEVYFIYNIPYDIKRIEEETTVSIKAKNKKYILDTDFYTEHFPYFEPTKRTRVKNLPETFEITLKEGKKEVIEPKSVTKVEYE